MVVLTLVTTAIEVEVTVDDTAEASEEEVKLSLLEVEGSGDELTTVLVEGLDVVLTSSVDVEADVLLASELEPDPAVPDGSLPEMGR